MRAGFPQSARSTPPGGLWAAERTADGRLVDAVLAQELCTAPVLPQDSEQQPRVDTGMAEVADREVAVAQPHRDRAAVAQRALEVEALRRVDEVAQRLVAQARGVEAARAPPPRDPRRAPAGGGRGRPVRGRDSRAPAMPDSRTRWPHAVNGHGAPGSASPAPLQRGAHVDPRSPAPALGRTRQHAQQHGGRSSISPLPQERVPPSWPRPAVDRLAGVLGVHLLEHGRRPLGERALAVETSSPSFGVLRLAASAALVRAVHSIIEGKRVVAGRDARGSARAAASRRWSRVRDASATSVLPLSGGAAARSRAFELPEADLRCT